VWTYIQAESLPIVPLYLAAERRIVERNGALITVDDERLRLLPRERAETRRVRFRTLGCWRLTGAIESHQRRVRRHRGAAGRALVGAPGAPGRWRPASLYGAQEKMGHF
jgi:3'-phosphoadenosine 5'-phosphosulfate sulfotransferase (PAPS reductase)/FAD synthetase